MSFFEETISSEEIYKGKIINVRRDKVNVQGERISYREIVEHPKGAGIVAIDYEDNIYMVKQYRKPFEKEILEIPAGKVDKDEDPKDTARRELIEETGLICDNLIPLGTFLCSPGFTDEVVYLYLAKDFIKGKSNPDEGEYLNVLKYKKDDILNMIKNDEINDGKSVAAILKAISKIY